MRYLLLFLLLLSVSASAQDLLQKTDGSRVEVKVLEISDTQVRYKLKSNPTGPTYVISKEDVIQITYESGVTEVIPKQVKRPSEQELPPYKDPDELETNFGHHFISVNLADMLAEALTMGYEYTFKSGDFSLKVPVSLGLGNNDMYNNGYGYGYYNNSLGYYNRDKIFSTGLDFYYYPFGQGKAKYFFGPSFEYGQFKSRVVFNDYNGQQWNESFKGNFRSLLLQNGFLFQPAKHFNISLNLGLGFSNVRINEFKVPANTYFNYYDAGARVALRGGLNMGIKF
jgi:hypothetical protein